MNVTVTFDPKCIENQPNVMERFLSGVPAGFKESVHIDKRDTTSCTFSVDTNLSPKNVESVVRDVLALMLGKPIADEYCTVSIAEGNKDDDVSYRVILVGDKTIRGFGMPDYAGR